VTNVLVCVKRVPATGGRITLTEDEQQIDTRFLGFTVSPHEECAVEEAVRIVEAHGGTSVVLTLGPEAAVEQLQDALAIGVERGLLLETDGREWDPVATAAAIVDAVTAQRAAGVEFDIILFGNEAADTGDYQVGVRVAQALGMPCVSGVKTLTVDEGKATARREAPGGGAEVFEVSLPAVFAVKEGINLPRYPSVPGRIKAKKKQIDRSQPDWTSGGLERIKLKLPPEQESQAEVLGSGPEAAGVVVDLLQRLGLVAK
jgi:electron transfer flavoprotein beta subunit